MLLATRDALVINGSYPGFFTSSCNLESQNSLVCDQRQADHGGPRTSTSTPIWHLTTNEVSEVAHQCERRRNSHVWWSSNGEWQTDTWVLLWTTLDLFKAIATKHLSGSVAEGVMEQATFSMFPVKGAQGRQITVHPVPWRRPWWSRKTTS